jgi:membrane protein
MSADDRSTGELVAQLSEDLSTLVRDEVALAKRDLATAGKRAGIGVGLFGAAGVVAWFAVGTLVAAAVLGLATALDAWLSALIIGAGLVVVAGLMALVGKSSVSKAPEPPRERVDSVKADVAAAKPGAEETL